jgi:hypothetical protein
MKLYSPCKYSSFLYKLRGVTTQKTPFFCDFSPQANYVDWATATGKRISAPHFADRGVSRGQGGGSPRPLISVF